MKHRQNNLLYCAVCLTGVLLMLELLRSINLGCSELNELRGSIIDLLLSKGGQILLTIGLFFWLLIFWGMDIYRRPSCSRHGFWKALMLVDYFKALLVVFILQAYLTTWRNSPDCGDARLLRSGIDQTTNILVIFAGFFLGQFFRTFKKMPPNVFLSVRHKILMFFILFFQISVFIHSDALHVYPYSAAHRWTGPWVNPNTYGMLMSAGVLLTIGLLATRKDEEGKNRKLLSVVLIIAVSMMGTGLIMSYSRGAWLGVVVGLLYLAKQKNSESGKRKAKTIWYVLSAACLAAAVVVIFWHNTSDDAPWYLKRADLSRPSAQHRVVAWKAGFEIMRDHPFGVGWNKTVETYEKNYSPPENGALAITTNDYLMLGTELGIPALVFFIIYVALQLGVGKTEESARENVHPTIALDGTQVACRAAVIAMLVEFWFDGGLFKLATASVFWILLELGAADRSPALRSPKAV